MFKFALGLWAGASGLACAVAWIYTFLATGKIAIPSSEGCQLMEVDQAADCLDEWIELNIGGIDE